MRRTLTPFLVVLGLPLTVVACLWDRDTPSNEAKGMPEVVAAITGRFERNPPLYYKMRLARVASNLEKHPEDLTGYDDAGVACDRLGLGDEAVSWMEKKRAQLDKKETPLAEEREHRYRYHANLGTFLVHRWIRNGADRAKIAEVESARDQIAKALEINPNAHFGREKYQLRAMEWIINPPTIGESRYVLPNFLGWDADDIYGLHTVPKDADEAVRGLSGLIVLGNAWESVDVFNALNIALQRDSVGFERGTRDSVGYERSRGWGRNTLAYLAWLRCRELVDSGKGSMVPDAPKGDALKAQVPMPGFVKADVLLDPAFSQLRAEADAWHAARIAFMMKRLMEGRHPDTDPHFWDGYVEKPAPSLPEQSVPEAYNAWHTFRMRMTGAVIFGTPGLLIVAVATFRILRARRDRLARALLESIREAG